MADYPTTDLQSQLIASGLSTSNPTNTYVDFANTMAKNIQDQQAQEQAIARAKELTKQSKIETSNQQGAQAAGYNPLLSDTMTPEEAVAYLKIVLKEKGLAGDQALIDEWAKTLPPRVNRQIVESFANRFSRETTRSGQPAMFDENDIIQIPKDKSATDLGLTDMKDAEGNSVDDKTLSDGTNTATVPNAGMYQVVYDNQGQIQKFIPGGKEAADKSASLDLKEHESNEKQWQKLDSQINTAFKTRSGGLGSLSSAIFRSVRAINTILTTENLTAQDLQNISQDIAGVFQGGAPTIESARGNDYSTVFTNFANQFRKYTGVIPNIKSLFGANNPLEETTNKLMQVLVDLRDSAINNLKSFIESEMPAFKGIIENDPQRWDEMQKAKLKFIESGLLVPEAAKTKLNITGGGDAATPKHMTTGVDEEKTAKKSAKVPNYTVEK